VIYHIDAGYVAGENFRVLLAVGFGYGFAEIKPAHTAVKTFPAVIFEHTQIFSVFRVVFIIKSVHNVFGFAAFKYIKAGDSSFNKLPTAVMPAAEPCFFFLIICYCKKRIMVFLLLI